MNELKQEFEYICIKDDFKDLISHYKKIYFSDIDKVNKEIDKILLSFSTYSNAPKFILNRALYQKEGINTFEKGKFVIRPGVNYSLENCADLKTSFIVINDNNFFVNFIQNIIDWVEIYNLNKLLSVNLQMLNNRVSEIIEQENFPYKLLFAEGEDIIDISDDFIKLGLSYENILKISHLGFFSEDLFWKQKSEIGFINMLKECNRPYDILKVKNDFTKELGVYNRKNIYKLLRKIVKRNINFVRVGNGYFEDENYFAIIEKIPLTESELKEYNDIDCIITDNLKPTQIEKKEKKTKILWKYKLSPFEKKTNILYDIKLKDLLEKG